MGTDAAKPSRKPPLWPWLVLLLVVLVVIFAYHETLDVLADLRQMGGDLGQLLDWLLSLVRQ